MTVTAASAPAPAPTVTEVPAPRREAVRSVATQADAPYLAALAAHVATGPLRLNVPGHKGGPGADAELMAVLGEQALAHDVPALIEGIDLGPAPTPQAEALRLAAEAWGAARTWFLTNGASQANHAACLALAQTGSKVVMQRTVHGSAVDGAVLAGLEPAWVAPAWDEQLGIPLALTPEALDRALAEAPDAVAAYVVSPTYHGACADVRALARIAHGHGAALVVDEAWGGHLAFHPDLPEDALSAGADLVISSTHKHVGSLTGSAMLHLGPEATEWITEEAVETGLGLVGSTSPNSLLLASLDAARRHAVQDGRDELHETMATLERLRGALKCLGACDVLDARAAGRPGVHAIDPLRLTLDLSHARLDGYELAAKLRDRDVHVELAGDRVLVAAFGLGEPAEASARRLLAALMGAFVEARREGRPRRTCEPVPAPVLAEPQRTPRTALLGPSEVVPFAAAAGRVAAQALSAYPPGIPNVLPGEVLTAAVLAYLARHRDAGGSIRGMLDPTLATVRVGTEDV